MALAVACFWRAFKVVSNCIVTSCLATNFLLAPTVRRVSIIHRLHSCYNSPMGCGSSTAVVEAGRPTARKQQAHVEKVQIEGNKASNNATEHQTRALVSQTTASSLATAAMRAGLQAAVDTAGKQKASNDKIHPEENGTHGKRTSKIASTASDDTRAKVMKMQERLSEPHTHI